MPVMLSVTGKLGRFEEFFSEVIYPAWPLWLAFVLVALAAAGYLAYRLGLHRWAATHRLLTTVAVAASLAVIMPAGYYTVSPLFERETVCEASPLAGAGSGSEACEGTAVAATGTGTPRGAGSPGTTGAPVEPSPATMVVASGEFAGADDFHFGEGEALLIRIASDRYVLRFENFSVRNGPDLFVYLSPDPDGYADGALKLGALKGTAGAFNYDVPEGTEVSRFKSAIVWCDQFSVLFATARFM